MHPLRAPRTALAFLVAALAAVGLPSTPRADQAVAASPHGFLGVSLEPVSEPVRAALGLEEGVGVLIRNIVKGGAAEEAGLVEGDVVLAAQERPVRGPRDLVRTVQGLLPSDRLNLELWRRGRVLHLDAVLQERPEGGTAPAPRPADRREMLGLSLLGLTDQLADYFTASGGTLVARVAEGSAAEVAGLLAGDVIVAVDGTEAVSSDHVRSLVAAAEGPTVLLGVVRNGSDISITVAIENR